MTKRPEDTQRPLQRRLSRRGFIRQSLLATSAMAFGSSLTGAAMAARAKNALPLLISAVSTGDGQHGVAGIDAKGQLLFRIAVNERCHGGCARPGGRDVISFARRPGRHFYVLDAAQGQIRQRIEANPAHHFYGHGVFSRDGRVLYLSASHFPSGTGLIQIFDAHRDYQQIGEHPVNGIGPHELRLHPDGETLVIALGGIRTHPDYDRVKLNLDEMAPALLLMNRHSGEIRQRCQPSHHQLSCRHLDVSPEGIVIAGYQFQGPEWESHPLIARLDTRSGDFRELSLAPELQTSLRQYTASVAVHPKSPVAALTAPRGNRIILVDTDSGRVMQAINIADVAGVMADGDEDFVASSGRGELFRVNAGQDTARKLGHFDWRWDNHLTAV